MTHLEKGSKWLNGLKKQHKNRFTSKEISSFIRQIPKVELHAHLNGCIRELTLLELARDRNVTLSSLLHDLQKECHATTEEKINEIEKDTVNNKRRSLLECFEIFSEIANCVTDLVALRRIAREACEDFAIEGVAYLELRSTPKILFSDTSNKRKCSKREYVETILDVMKDFEAAEQKRYANERSRNSDSSGSLVRLPMKARFIVSANRADSVQDAMEHAQLAIDLVKEGNPFVVGFDLSGNPMKNVFKELEPCFNLVRKAGLGVSIHCGEIPCQCDATATSDETPGGGPIIQFAFQDTKDILAFKPDRLGHALLLTEEMYDELEASNEKIPIECCPTSNVMTLELATRYEGDLVHGLRQHPRLKNWLDSEFPISISTDDPGIFNTNPTTELTLLVEAFEMDNPWRIVSLMIESIEHIFESDAFKNELREGFMTQIAMIPIDTDQ